MAGDWFVGSSFAFKSDRCGIETVLAYLVIFASVGFKSDRCGIETVFDCLGEVALLQRSNQTVAGLKRHSRNGPG